MNEPKSNCCGAEIEIHGNEELRNPWLYFCSKCGKHCTPAVETGSLQKDYDNMGAKGGKLVDYHHASQPIEETGSPQNMGEYAGDGGKLAGSVGPTSSPKGIPASQPAPKEGMYEINGTRSTTEYMLIPTAPKEAKGWEEEFDNEFVAQHYDTTHPTDKPSYFNGDSTGYFDENFVKPSSVKSFIAKVEAAARKEEWGIARKNINYIYKEEIAAVRKEGIDQMLSIRGIEKGIREWKAEARLATLEEVDKAIEEYKAARYNPKSHPLVSYEDVCEDIMFRLASLKTPPNK